MLSHKTKVVIQYLTPIALGYFTLAAYLFTGEHVNVEQLAPYAGGVAGLVAAMALAQDLIPKWLKESLVFFRFNDRLPGHRAFSAQFERPDRFDYFKILNWSALGMLDSASQQRIFYSLYKKFSNEPSVEHYSFRYLAWRDSSTILMILTIITAPSAHGIGDFPLAISLKLTAGTFVGFLFTSFAARQSAQELIFQVFSYETREGAHDVSE